MTTSQCRKIVLTLSDYIDGELHGAARIRLQLHLAVCPLCGRTYRTLVRTLMLYKAWESAPGSWPDRARTAGGEDLPLD